MGRFCSAIASMLGAGGFLLALAIVGWQTIQWLKVGAWSPLAVNDALVLLGIARPTFPWLGLQTLADSLVYECPLSLGIFAAALSIALLAVAIPHR